MLNKRRTALISIVVMTYSSLNNQTCFLRGMSTYKHLRTGILDSMFNVGWNCVPCRNRVLQHVQWDVHHIFIRYWSCIIGAVCCHGGTVPMVAPKFHLVRQFNDSSRTREAAADASQRCMTENTLLLYAVVKRALIGDDSRRTATSAAVRLE